MERPRDRALVQVDNHFVAKMRERLAPVTEDIPSERTYRTTLGSLLRTAADGIQTV